jgi:hypothetical protein
VSIDATAAVVVGGAAATGAVSVRVYVVPADAAATATIGAAGPTVSTTVPGPVRVSRT